MGSGSGAAETRDEKGKREEATGKIPDHTGILICGPKPPTKRDLEIVAEFAAYLKKGHNDQNNV